MLRSCREFVAFDLICVGIHISTLHPHSSLNAFSRHDPIHTIARSNMDSFPATLIYSSYIAKTIRIWASYHDRFP